MLGGTLAAVLGLPIIAIVWFRVAGGVLGYAETGWLLFWLAVLSTGILGFLLWRLVLRPVRTLTAHAQAVKAGLDTPPPRQFGTPEFTDLGRAVTTMGDSLHNRAASLRAYADHVTHELKSPLTSLQGAAELLGEDVPAPDRAALLATLRRSADRMEALLATLQRSAAASQSAGPGQTQLADLPTALHGLRIKAAAGTIPLARPDMDVVLDHLAQNAAAHGATCLSLTCEGHDLRIADNGPGISPGNAPRIFDPFFTTRRAEGGTGMGLSIVQMLLAARGAQITHEASCPGTAFLITFD
ncbi:MAG: ATP-binding protein [Pseudomonadota bacterium]